jgi:hypothetical protein
LSSLAYKLEVRERELHNQEATAVNLRRELQALRLRADASAAADTLTALEDKLKD